MKTGLLVLGTLLFAMVGDAQRAFIIWPTDANTDKIVFAESVPSTSSNGASSFMKAATFLKNTFKGEKDTVVIDNSTRTIVCKSAYFIPIPELGEKGKGYISYSFTVWCHQNYYSYALTDFEHHSLTANGARGGPLENDKTISGQMLFPSKYWNDLKAKCYDRIQTTIGQFKRAMKLNSDI